MKEEQMMAHDLSEPSAEASRDRLSRRTFLRGAGVVMALPWMESMARAGREPYPKRFGALFMACGVNADHWWAKGHGRQMELGKSLRPLEPLKHKMNFITGLFNRSAVGVGIHPGQTGNILSGATLQKGAVLKGGISVDQMLARHRGHLTLQPSLVLGCEQPTTGYHETNFSMAYSSHISWQNNTSPVPLEVYPSLAFDRLFENQGNLRNQSVLDRVRSQAAALSRRVSLNDRAKLDEYLTSVREIERQIERLRTVQTKAAETALKQGKHLFEMERPENGLPEDIRDHMRLMCDLVALAFQTDKTRVATLLLCRDISGLFYPFLNVRHSHHSASHRDLSEAYEQITRYYCGQVAYLAGRLDQMVEGEGTVLDNTCLLFMSNMWSGSRHDSTKLPVLQLGSLGGSIETGRVLDYLDRSDEDRKLCSLYLSIMDRMGVELEHFGDADTRLARI